MAHREHLSEHDRLVTRIAELEMALRLHREHHRRDKADGGTYVRWCCPEMAQITERLVPE